MELEEGFKFSFESIIVDVIKIRKRLKIFPLKVLYDKLPCCTLLESRLKLLKENDFYCMICAGGVRL